jgi:hypothetical protein
MDMEVAMVARLKTEGNIQKRPTVFAFVLFGSFAPLHPRHRGKQAKERAKV